MRVQIDRFEGGGWAVGMAYAEGRTIFDVPRGFFPDGASVDDVYEVRVERAREETGRSPDGLPGGGG